MRTPLRMARTMPTIFRPALDEVAVEVAVAVAVAVLLEIELDDNVEDIGTLGARGRRLCRLVGTRERTSASFPNRLG